MDQIDIATLVFIDATGYHYADFPTFLLWAQQQYQGIYGSDVYLGADSQDGQMVAVFANAFFVSAAVGASNYNSFSPATAQGVGLSRVVKINGLRRQAATNSTADLTITGTAGTTINNGIAQDSTGNKWDLPASITIPEGGSIIVTATCETQGAITAGSGTITTIFTPTLGWQTVTNASDATPGVAAETDAALRIRQSQSTANPSLTVFDGTIGALENVSGVSMVRGYENDTGSTDGNGIPAHTISCVVEGGDAVEICQTIQIHKTPGVGTYGTTSETVTDAKGMPLVINFFRPTPIAISVVLTLDVGDGFSSDYETQIAQAVADYINAIGIGNDVLYSKIYIPSYLPGVPGTTYDITALTVNGGTSNISIAFNQVATCDPSDVTFIT